MSLSLGLKLLHVLSAFWFIAGVVGRGVTFRLAKEASDFRAIPSLLKASDIFERRMVIPGSMAVFLMGLLAAWAGGWPMLGSLQGAPTNWLLVSIVLYLATIPAIPTYLIPRRAQRDQAAKEALAEGRVTPALAAALSDRGVGLYRTVEMFIIGVIVVLMVTKPF
jgi:uncharacterized membrane protein